MAKSFFSASRCVVTRLYACTSQRSAVSVRHVRAGRFPAPRRVAVCVSRHRTPCPTALGVVWGAVGSWRMARTPERTGRTPSRVSRSVGWKYPQYNPTKEISTHKNREFSTTPPAPREDPTALTPSSAPCRTVRCAAHPPRSAVQWQWPVRPPPPSVSHSIQKKGIPYGSIDVTLRFCKKVVPPRLPGACGPKGARSAVARRSPSLRIFNLSVVCASQYAISRRNERGVLHAASNQACAFEHIGCPYGIHAIASATHAVAHRPIPDGYLAGVRRISSPRQIRSARTHRRPYTGRLPGRRWPSPSRT